jgi:NADPH:quinone reductase-like Zn-dependent oxidoreductase
MAHKVIYERSGEPAQVVRVVESDEPQAPQRGQVLVRVTAFSVHPGDLAGIAGPFAGADGDMLVPGLEATGTVEAIGPDTPGRGRMRRRARHALPRAGRMAGLGACSVRSGRGGAGGHA